MTEFPCDYCPRKYNTRINMMLHMISQHQMMLHNPLQGTGGYQDGKRTTERGRRTESLDK